MRSNHLCVQIINAFTCVQNLRPPAPTSLYFVDIDRPYCDISYQHPQTTRSNHQKVFASILFWCAFWLILPKTLGPEVIIIDIRKISSKNQTILPLSQFCIHYWDKHLRGKYFKHFTLVCNIKFQQNEKLLSTEKLKINQNSKIKPLLPLNCTFLDACL